jgi:hypothetical protein
MFLLLALVHGGIAFTMAITGDSKIALMQLTGSAVYLVLAAFNLEERGKT